MIWQLNILSILDTGNENAQEKEHGVDYLDRQWVLHIKIITMYPMKCMFSSIKFISAHFDRLTRRRHQFKPVHYYKTFNLHGKEMDYV